MVDRTVDLRLFYHEECQEMYIPGDFQLLDEIAQGTQGLFRWLQLRYNNEHLLVRRLVRNVVLLEYCWCPFFDLESRKQYLSL